jgi:hypothetical protein
LPDALRFKRIRADHPGSDLSIDELENGVPLYGACDPIAGDSFAGLDGTKYERSHDRLIEERYGNCNGVGGRFNANDLH